MKAVFLCAGVGRRMFPFTEDKFLFPFLGRSLLEHQVERAKAAGLRDFLFISRPDNQERVRATASAIPGIRADFAVQERPLGMGDALLSASARLGTDSILVVSPNDVVEADAYRQVISRGTEAGCLLGYRVREYFPGGYLVVDGEEYLKQIVEKPGPGSEPSDLVNLVLHFHPHPDKLLRALREEAASPGKDDVYERALQHLIAVGERMRVVPYSGFWGPIKYPWHLLAVMEHFLKGVKGRIAPGVQLSPRAVVEGEVVLETEVRVLENAVIRGPAYIGAGALIGNNVLVREGCHIGAGCVVGFSTEVKHAYIGDGCWFHTNYVGDSVVGEGCTFGAGTVTANFRFDRKRVLLEVDGERVDTGRDHLGAMLGDRCSLGVHVTLLPGVRVGKGATVGPHLLVSRDLKPGEKRLSPRRRG